jgi:hypothetical protein
MPTRLHLENGAAPTLAPSARGDRWVGEKRVLGIYNTRLRSIAALRRGLAVVVPRVAEYRHLGELGCEMLRLPDGAPVWSGDLIKVQDHGTYVVMSIPHIDLEVEPDGSYLESDGSEGDSSHWRPAIYNLERLKAWTA